MRSQAQKKASRSTPRHALAVSYDSEGVEKQMRTYVAGRPCEAVVPPMPALTTTATNNVKGVTFAARSHFKIKASAFFLN